jgi:hypothetical protein
MEKQKHACAQIGTNMWNQTSSTNQHIDVIIKQTKTKKTKNIRSTASN